MTARDLNAAGPDRTGLTVLVVDDEAPALSELVYLLQEDIHIGEVLSAESGAEALRLLQVHDVDGVFLDIHMPGLSGVELAGVLARFRDPPPVIFVTAFEDHAVEAFQLNAVDYVLKPIHPRRLAEAIRRLVSVTTPTAAAPQPTAGAPNVVDEATIPVELAGVTRFIALRDVRYVESHGDYARLHTDTATHLLRVPMGTLEARWADAGFVRIHRSYLVSLAHITEVRLSAEQGSVMLGNVELAVSRRHTRALRELLVRRARPWTGGDD